MMDLQVNKSHKINIGGVEQFLFERGKHLDNPILLMLHGGPGTPLSVIHSVLPKEIEENFIVVHWDQRGAGKSFNQSIPKESMNVEQFISDTIEVTDYLLNEYNREKIFLLGISWGSVIGLNAAKLHPEKYYSYIGMSQVVDMQKGEIISYDFLLEQSKKLANEEAVRELESIGRPPYENIDEISIQRKWLKDLGFAERKINSSKFYMEKCSDDEIQNIVKGIGFTEETLIDSILDLDFKDITELELPTYICMGKYDYQTPFVLAKEFFNNLKAPKKEFIWYEESAHGTILEEPERTVEILLKVLDENYKRG